MKVSINGQIKIKHVLTDHGKFFYLDRGERVYCQKLRSGILVPVGEQA